MAAPGDAGHVPIEPVSRPMYPARSTQRDETPRARGATPLVAPQSRPPRSATG